MPTDICERQNIWPFHGYAPGGYMCHCMTCGSSFAGDKRAMNCLPCAVSETRAEVSRLSAELEGARKATIEEMALVAEECDIVMKLIVGGPDGASIARRCIAAAIRQKGERDES